MPVQTVLWMYAPERFAGWCRRRYGEVFTLRLPFNGSVVQVCDPDAIRAVFAAPGDEARAGEANGVLRPLLGDRSVLLLDGREHLRQRRLMLPAFHGERMQGYSAAMEEIARREVESWPVGVDFALRPRMQAVTLEVILRTVFGAGEGAEVTELRRVLVALLDMPLARIGLLPWLRRDRGERSSWGRFLRRREDVDRAVYALIAARRREPAGERDDVLSMLLGARDETDTPMTDVELRDELMTLLIAGHETTATALAWFFETALRDPAVEARLREELDGGGSAYLDACIKEILRLRPVVPVVVRRLHAPLQLVAGVTLPAGVAVAPNIALTHRNARLHPDPEVFRPERFLGTRTDPAAWLPFGGGIRRCLGASFATIEMRAVIPAVLRSVRLRPAGPPERVTRRAVTFVPHRGARVRVEERISAR